MFQKTSKKGVAWPVLSSKLWNSTF